MDGSPRHDHADRYGAISMQALKILQVTIEKRIFVIPLDFQRDRAAGKFADVIDLVRNRLAHFAVDDFLNDKFGLRPAQLSERFAEPLRALRLTPAASDSRGRKQDRARVAGGQDYEVGYEAKKTGKSELRQHCSAITVDATRGIWTVIWNRGKPVPDDILV